MKKAIIYVRVSTEEQAKHGLSLDAQERVCQKLAEQNGYKSVEIIKDEGESAGSINRPGLKRMLRLCEEGGIETIFTVHSDRLARNTEDHLAMQRLFSKHNISIIYALQPNIDRKTALGQTMDTVMAAFNEMQRLAIAEKTKSALEEKAREGWFPGVAPLGYANVDNPNFRNGEISKRIIVLDAPKARMVKKLFELYATGNYSVYELSDMMRKQGLRTKKGGLLHPSKIYEMLKNPIYIGELHWGDIIVKNAKHKPIIDKKTFQRIQTILDNHNHHTCRRRKYQFLLRGFVYCADCGKRLTAEWHLKKSGLKFAYYHCPMRDGCKKSNYIDISVLEKQIENKFKEIQFSEDFIKLVCEKARIILEDKKKTINADKRSLYNQKTAIEQQRDVAEQKLFKGILSDEDFTRNRIRFKEELDDIQSAIDKLDEQKEVKVDEIQKILKFARNIYASYKEAPYSLKRLYLGFFWERFEVKSKVIIKAEPTLLFKTLLDNHKVIINDSWGD
ncbi:MAG: recombinase family protein [Candidatus Pacebacteria bacterium]|nr:recombinase family protein [Candidatus Paceibacterota bacterium]